MNGKFEGYSKITTLVIDAMTFLYKNRSCLTTISNKSMEKNVFLPQKHYQGIIDMLEKHYPKGFFNNNQEVGDLSVLFSIPQFQFLQEHSPCAIFILNYMNMRYDYCSENIKGILGYDASRYKQNDGFEFALSTFNPDHAIVFSQKIIPKILEYFTEYPSGTVKKLRFSFTFLCKKSNGEYAWCTQQISVLETDANGLPLFTLAFLSDISNVKKDEQLDFLITEKKEDGTMDPIFATTYLDHISMTFLSKREIEVLKLISKGFSTPEIASQLFISQDTVYNHRKNMLEKAKAKNTAELLKLAMTKGII